MPNAPDRTPSQLSLFSISPVIGAWWEELQAQKLFEGSKPAVVELFYEGRLETHQGNCANCITWRTACQKTMSSYTQGKNGCLKQWSTTLRERAFQRAHRTYLPHAVKGSGLTMAEMIPDSIPPTAPREKKFFSTHFEIHSQTTSLFGMNPVPQHQNLISLFYRTPMGGGQHPPHHPFHSLRCCTRSGSCPRRGSAGRCLLQGQGCFFRAAPSASAADRCATCASAG